jgi:ribosomal protein S18 acetylase RimI-like enzyme
MRIRNAGQGDGLALWLLLQGPALMAGDDPVTDGPEAPDLSYLLGAGTRVAEEDDGRLVGAYRLHLRNTVAGAAGELLFLAVDDTGRERGVDRLLVEEMTRSAALDVVDRVRLVATPPHDGFFRDRGAEAVRLEGPFGRITWPCVGLELPVR